jgi:hypothetical protein
VKRRSRGGAFLAAALVAALALASFAPSALAVDEFGGKLPANTWTASPIEGPIAFEIGEEYKNGNSICIGPVTSSLTFPYGWKCGQPKVSWKFPAPLVAHAGVKNQNNFTITFGVSWT